jgi:hypothetical protein
MNPLRVVSRAVASTTVRGQIASRASKRAGVHVSKRFVHMSPQQDNAASKLPAWGHHVGESYVKKSFFRTQILPFNFQCIFFGYILSGVPIRALCAFLCRTVTYLCFLASARSIIALVHDILFLLVRYASFLVAQVISSC